jgi:hypothetical protein
MTCSSSSSSASTSASGLQLLVAATTVLTQVRMPKSVSKHKIVLSTPSAPKKVRFAKSCAAAAPYISSLTFDVGGGDKTSWLRMNHRANPKHKVLFNKLYKAEKRQAEKFHFLWSLNKHPLQQNAMKRKEGQRLYPRTRESTNL